MNKILELMKEQLITKEKELEKDKQRIVVYAETEINTSNYEKNTIAILNNMIETKAEINVLKHWISVNEHLI